MRDLNDLLNDSLKDECKKFTISMKTRFVEILNNHRHILFEFIQFVCKRVLLFEKVDAILKPIYHFLSHIFTHFSKTDSVNPDELEQLVCDTVDYLSKIAISGATTKLQNRSLKIITLILSNLDNSQYLKIFEDYVDLKENMVKLCYIILKSKNQQIWQVGIELYKNVISKITTDIRIVFDDIFYEQALTNDKTSVRQKSIQMMELTKAKVKGLQELCVDKDPSVRISVYEKLHRQESLLKISEGKLFRFLTRGFSEYNNKVKKAFYDLMISYLIKSPDEEVKIESKESYEFSMNDDQPKNDEVQTISFNYDYQYEGTRKRQVRYF
jgi:hypothetical protein